MIHVSINGSTLHKISCDFTHVVYDFEYIGTHPLVSASDSSLRKTLKVILKVMKPVGPYRNITVFSGRYQVVKSFPVVRFTLTNLFYCFEVIANEMKRYITTRNLIVLENDLIQFTYEECPSFLDIDML